MRDEFDDQIEAALRGFGESSPDLDKLAQSANETAAGIELPKTDRVMRMPEMDIRPEEGPSLAGAFPKPDTFATPAARPGSIPAQLGASITAAAPPKATRAVNLAAPLGARDTELEGLQKSAKDRRAASGVGQAVTDFIERPTNLLDYAQRLGGGGVSAAPKSKMWQDAEGDRDIADLEQRRASEVGMTKARTNAELAAEKKDPNSETAKTYRAVLSKFSPDVDLSNATPEQMERIAPWLEKFAAENADTLRAQAAATAKAEQQAKADAEKKAALDLAAKNRSEDVADRRANTAATQGLARASLGLRAGEIARDVDETRAEQQVPGYTHNPKVKQAPGEVGKVRGMVASAQTISDNIGELDALIEKYGTETLPTEAKARMQSLGANILAELKGEAGFQLGVLAGPDMEIMKEAIGDATALTLGNLVGQSDTTRVKLKQSRDSMMRKLSNRMKTGGYTPNAEAPAGGTVEVVDKKGQKYNVPAAEAEALKAELRAEGLL